MIKDKFLISGGYMCDMSYVTTDDTKPAFIHLTKSGAVKSFDKKLFWDWYQPLANEGLNQHRIAIYCVGGKMPTGGRSVIFLPWKFIKAKDAWQFYHIEVIGQDTTGKDISKVVEDFNEDFFTIKRQMCIELNKMNVQVMDDLADECQSHFPLRIAQSPFFHNVNGINGIYDPKALSVWGAYARKEIANLKDLKLKNGDPGVIFEIGNEINGKGGVEVGKVIIDELFAADIKPWNISIGAYMIQCKFMGKDAIPKYVCEDDFTNQEKIAKYLGEKYEKKYPDARNQAFRPVHAVGGKATISGRPFGERLHQAVDWWVDKLFNSARLILSSDGADGADGKGGRPSPARMKQIILYVLNRCPKSNNYMAAGHYKFIFDHLPGGEKTPDVAKMIRAMAEAHYEFFGVWPENRGKIKPYVEPKPEPVIVDECKPGETKAALCEDGSTIITHACDVLATGNRWIATGNMCAIIQDPVVVPAPHTAGSHIFKWPPNFTAFFKHVFGMKH